MVQLPFIREIRYRALEMSYFAGKSILITGASAGIGLELARQLGQQNSQLLLIARRGERLKKICEELNQKSIRSFFCEGDVTKIEDLQRAVAQCLEHFGKLDIVIANAGFGVAGELSSLSVADYRRQFETNVFGLLNTIYASEKALEAAHGQLVLVGSVAGFVPLPGNSAYTMSKFCVRALAKALQYEWKKKGISVTHIAPGFVESDIRRTDNLGQLKENHPDPIPSWIRVPTPTAVKEVLRAIQKKKKQKIITGHGKVIILFNQYFPGLIPWLVSLGGIKSRPEPKESLD